MKKTKFHIDLPTEEEISNQVSIIISKGLPQRQTMLQTIVDIWRDFPRKQFIFGMSEWLFTLILFVSSIVTMILVIKNDAFEITNFYKLSFVLSPFVFLTLTGASYMNKKLNGVLELEMTTKYTLYQVLAVRMLLYSMVASVLIITCSFIASLFIKMEVLRSIPIALSGLFLFASCFLFFFKERYVYVRTGLFCIVWTGGNILFSQMFKNGYELMIVQFPIIIYFVIMFVTFGLFLYAVKQFFTRDRGGVYECLL
ncbi:MAG: hypothetical protein ACI35O_16715 [Bacillaceae bacterium]